MSQTEKIDILDRKKIIDDIEQILVLLSEQKQGRVFALDGKWGYGKTYTGTVRKGARGTAK